MKGQSIMTIALCICLEEKRGYYNDKLCDMLIEKNQIYSIDTFSSPYTLLNLLEDGIIYDYIFFDTETTQRYNVTNILLSKRTKTPPLALITNENRVINLDNKTTINECHFDSFFDENQSNICKNDKINYYVLKMKQKIIRIPYDEIVYIESGNSRCIIHTYNDHSYNVYHKSLKQIAESLYAVRFITLSRSYIVNMDYIKSLENNVCKLKTNLNLSVSRNRIKEVRKIFNLFVYTDFTRMTENDFRELVNKYL